MKIKKLAVLLSLLFVPFLFCGCSNVVATVNGQPITQQELDKNLEETFGKQMLDTLIVRKLVEQDAKKKGITVSDAEVDAQLDKIKKKLTPADLQNLSGKKLDDLKKQIRFNLLLEKCIMASVPQSEVRSYFEKNKDNLQEVELSDILVEDKKQADAILGDLNRGVPFATVASQFSLDRTTRDNGGYLGVFPKWQLESLYPPLANVAFSLAPGQISKPIKTPNGYYILKVLNRKNSFDQLKDEVEGEMASQRIKQYLQNLRESAKIDYKGEFAQK
jgi:foldase protein PrsA